ncbi:MAG: hypothetical protein E7181_01140 [Erysipelotrichaceae bacterium]|nr:hypothetical protein [Erysipelotrichaceae bacterium]
MNDKLANYFKSFNEQLTDDLGSRFDYSKLLMYGKKKKASLSYDDEMIDLPWIHEAEEVVSKIKTIVNNINPNINLENEFENSEFDTFEDRYIVFLIDQLSSLLAVTSSNLASSTKKLNDYFIGQNISLNDVALLKDVKVLSANNNLFVEEQRKLLQLRETLGLLMETNYYNCLKKSVYFDDKSVCINGVIANDPLYGACYDFYKRLKELLSAHYDLPAPVRNNDYHNYLLLCLLLTLDNIGFVLNGASPEFDNKDYLLKVKNLKFSRNNINLSINTDSDDHIDLLFEDNNDYKQKGKRISKVSLDLYPSLDKVVPTNEEASSYFAKKVNARLSKGYDNAFVITTLLGLQNNNIIIASPNANPFDANLTNMIESCLLYLPANAFTYSHYCPICGGHVESSDNNGNYECSVCGSKYMLLTDKEKKEYIWVKRLSNKEGE